MTVTAELRAGVAPGEPDLASDILSHAVDGRPPAVRIDLPQTGATLPSGPQTISGSASDHGGGGVASVEVRVDDGPWIAASGARTWSAQIDVPASGQFTLRARAFDVYGYAGEADSVAVAVDNEAPAASIDATPPVLGGARFRLTGTAADPAGGAVARAEIQVDGGPWQRVLPPYTDAGGGAVAWTYGWSLPTGEGVEHTLRARATDQAGNTGPASAATTVTVDTVVPTSTIVYPQQGALLDDRTVLVWGLADDGWAVDRADVSLDGGTTWDAALLGDAARDLLDGLGVPAVPPDDHVWAVQLEANSFHLAIRSRAADPAGNTEPLRAPVRATVEHVRYWLPLMLEQ
ncbi:MAG: Ig-like domain-containing protein [Caldilineales bacterium]